MGWYYPYLQLQNCIKNIKHYKLLPLSKNVITFLFIKLNVAINLPNILYIFNLLDNGQSWL